MKLKQLLQGVDSKDDLLEICRTDGIQGFSDKDRSLKGSFLQEYLQRLIYQTMNSTQFIKDLLNNLPKSAIILLDLLLKIQNQEEVYSAYTKKYAYSTLLINLRRLAAAGIIFYSESGVLIPDDFNPWITEYIAENNVSIEDASEEESAVEELVFKDFDALMWSALVPIENLRFFLDEQKAPTEGTKKMLITRIFYELKVTPENYLNAMFSKSELLIIADLLKIRKSGTKDELVKRIKDTLPLRTAIENYSPENEIGETESNIARGTNTKQNLSAGLVACPACNITYKVKFNTAIFESLHDGIARVLVTPPCSHKFLVFVDSNLQARNVERIDVEGAECKHADTTYLELRIKQLEEHHAKLARNKEYSEAFEVMHQIKTAKKELETLNQGVREN